ncbi:MAG: hypothetical protein HY704_16790 [Gemmatimonadetes bacterium]|nr:hypothetical protein [Gemmatimonadota bacterium]
MVAFYVFLALVLVRAVVILVALAFLVQPVSSCPACFAPTLPIVKRWLRILAPRFEWRWCPRCGWQGPARRVHDAPMQPWPIRGRDPGTPRPTGPSADPQAR